MKAIIIPGSPSSVTDMQKTPWIINLTEFIRKVYTNFKHIKILGICFGHQVVAQALGGEVEKSTKPKYIGKETI